MKIIFFRNKRTAIAIFVMVVFILSANIFIKPLRALAAVDWDAYWAEMDAAQDAQTAEEQATAADYSSAVDAAFFSEETDGASTPTDTSDSEDIVGGGTYTGASGNTGGTGGSGSATNTSSSTGGGGGTSPTTGLDKVIIGGKEVYFDPATFLYYDSTGKKLNDITSLPPATADQIAALTRNGSLLDQIAASGGSKEYTIQSIDKNGNAIVGVINSATGAKEFLTISLGTASSQFKTGDSVKLGLATSTGAFYNNGVLTNGTSVTAAAINQQLIAGNLAITKVTPPAQTPVERERIVYGFDCNLGSGCRRVVDGEYGSLSLCNNSCNSTVETYSCNSLTGACYRDTNGPSNLAICQNNCRKINQAISLTANKVIVLKNEPVVLTAMGQDLNPNILNWTIGDDSLTNKECLYSNQWGVNDKLQLCVKVGSLSAGALIEANNAVSSYNLSISPTINQGATNTNTVGNVTPDINTNIQAPPSATESVTARSFIEEVLQIVNPVNWFKPSLTTQPNQCADGTSCTLCGNSCLKVNSTDLKNIRCPDVYLPDAQCTCVNNSCRLSSGTSALLDTRSQWASSFLGSKAIAATELNSSVEYSWPRIGIYGIVVEGFDLSGNPVISNPVSIEVIDAIKYACNSITGDCEVNGSGSYDTQIACENAGCVIGPPPPPPPADCKIESATMDPSKTMLLGSNITFNWETSGCINCDISCDQTSNCGFNSPSVNVGINSDDNPIPTEVKPKASGYYSYKLSCQGEGVDNKDETDFAKGVYDGCSDCLRVRRFFIFETPAFLKMLIK